MALLRFSCVLLCVAAYVTACSTNVDCSLNGVCDGGTCTCNPAWTGETCGMLAFKANAIPPNSGYGWATAAMTSWGGNIVKIGAQYHMYVAEMALDCPLRDWGHNSLVTHAVSNTPVGPFQRQDTALAPWSHNPQVVMDNSTSPPTFVLFHIGSGEGGHPTNCTQPSPRAPAPSASTAGSTLHTATNPSGPWTPIPSAPKSCNNPSPFLNANGTWFLVCGSSTLYRASTYKGPWTQVSTLPRSGIHANYEDAFLFMDTNDNFHVLFHLYNATTPCGACTGEIVSGHDFSKDGYTWYSSSVQPYSQQYTLTNGTTVTPSTRERPKLLFNDQGIPTHLINGVSTVTTCPPTPAVNCKYTVKDVTVVAPLTTAV